MPHGCHTWNPGRAFPGRRPAPAPKYLLPMHGPACERNFWKAQLPARLAAPTNNKGKQRLREKRRVAEKKITFTISVYSSSASPRTSRPARSQLFRSHDQRSPRTAHPLSRSLSPPASPRSCPCLCTERRRNNHSASPRAQPHADATPRAPPNERALPRQILQRLTVWLPTILDTL